MKPETRAAFPAFTRALEGDCPYLYTDRVGLVTCAWGDLVDAGPRRFSATDPLGASDSAPAQNLGWVQPDGTLATQQQIRTAWWAVKMAWPELQSVECAKLTTIRLPPAAVDALAFRTLDGMWAMALRYFPDLENWPAPAQLVVCSMAWAMGGAFEAGYPKFDAAARAHNWAACADECAMTKAPVPAERNAKNRLLCLGAAYGLTIAQSLAQPPPAEAA
jgi:hypothetical protein